MTRYLFLDGNALRMHLKQFSARYAAGAPLSVDWQQIKGQYDKVFYYDAIPVIGESESKEAYQDRISSIAKLHERLSEIDGFRVYEGDARKRSGRGLEQKKVDVMIAVDMLTHTIRRNMDSAGLLAGDLDFKPLLDALVNEGMFVTLHYPPRSTSKELRAAADARKPLTPRITYHWLDHDSQLLVGVMPTASRSGGLSVINCAKILEVESEVPQLTIWHDLSNDTIVVSWLDASPTTYQSILGGNWDKTRKLVKDEFGISLPDALPTSHQQL